MQWDRHFAGIWRGIHWDRHFLNDFKMAVVEQFSMSGLHKNKKTLFVSLLDLIPYLSGYKSVCPPSYPQMIASTAALIDQT